MWGTAISHPIPSISDYTGLPMANHQVLQTYPPYVLDLWIKWYPLVNIQAKLWKINHHFLAGTTHELSMAMFKFANCQQIPRRSIPFKSHEKPPFSQRFFPCFVLIDRRHCACAALSAMGRIKPSSPNCKARRRYLTSAASLGRKTLGNSLEIAIWKVIDDWWNLGFYMISWDFWKKKMFSPFELQGRYVPS